MLDVVANDPASPPVAPPLQEWMRPGAFEAAPGVFRIPLPMPNDGLAAVNVYAIEDKSGLTLIDGGWAVPPARRDLELALKSLGASPKSISRILVTHAHRDHYTMAVHLRREFGIPIALGIGEKTNLENILKGPKNFETQLVLLREAGADELASIVEKGDRMMEALDGWEMPSEWLFDGTEIDLGTRRLRVLSTPGHTQGHVVFADTENGLLLAGDHVLPNITPSIGLEGIVSESPLGDFLSSLHKVAALPDLKLLAAHGPVADSTHKRVGELVAHHGQRLEEMRLIVVNGSAAGVNALTVASSIGWTRHKRALEEMTWFNQMLAVSETIAHLRLLVLMGKLVKRADPSGVVLYSAPPPLPLTVSSI